MYDDAEIHKNKRPEKTYVSPRVKTPEGPLRIASKVLDSAGLHFAMVKAEVILRRTEARRTEIVAKFLEDDRQIKVLTLQSFSGTTGAPRDIHFSFIGVEIPKLLAFLQQIALLEFEDEKKVNITDVELRKLTISKTQAASLVQDNQDLFAEIMRSDITKEDIVTIGYRRKQLVTFKRLLDDRSFFDSVKVQKKLRGDEALWQAFFEKNQWLFGYGLSYFFVTGFDNRKLEQAVQGYDFVHPGKRADSVMKSRGIINSLCFVEIKTHETKLLDESPYRVGCWAPSKYLVGAVAQVQGTVASAMQNLYGMIRPTENNGEFTGEEVFNFRPRAFIVAGSLGEFVSEHGVNHDQFRSFELYRNSISDIEILTFDELYERTRFIVNSSGVEVPNP